MVAAPVLKHLQNILPGQHVATSGCDPEIFVVDATDKLIPAFKFLPSKHDPKPHGSFLDYSLGVQNLSYYDHSGVSYWDGFQAEFTTQGTHCHGYLFDMVRAGLKSILLQAKAFDAGAKLTINNVFRLDEPTRANSAPEHLALGCEPSFNAYDAEPLRVEDPVLLPFRMAGGHIHMGVPKKLRDESKSVVQMLDLLIGLPCVGIFAKIDDPVRRRFYGRAGEFRIPPHGIEYRTLSNAWLGHPAMGHMIFDVARLAVEAATRGIGIEDVGISADKLQAIINECDVDAARIFFKDNIALWDTLGPASWAVRKSARRAFNSVVLEGADTVFPTYTDIAKNWRLDERWFFHTNGLKDSWSGQFPGV